VDVKLIFEGFKPLYCETVSLELWDYRRRMHEIYRNVRLGTDPAMAWARWREERDELFRTHPESPIPASDRAGFRGLDYFPYDPTWRVEGIVETVDRSASEIGHSSAGTTLFRDFAVVHFATPSGAASLRLLWLETYGGGVFLPFRDETNGSRTYGGGRYLLDTAKGADLGHRADRIVLDFNFSFHPSCVHDHRWSCPLAPADNHLAIGIEAGERL